MRKTLVISKNRFWQLILIFGSILAIVGLLFLYEKKYRPTADVAPDTIAPLSQLVAYVICLEGGAGPQTLKTTRVLAAGQQNCDGELTIWLNGYYPYPTDNWFEVNKRYSPTSQEDNPEYNEDQVFHIADIEGGTEEYDPEGDMIPDSWTSSGGGREPAFVYIDREVDKEEVLDRNGAEFEYEVIVHNGSDESKPSNVTIKFPLSSQPQPL